LWHAYRGSEQEALDRVLASFRAAHPNDTVEVLALPFDAYASKLEAAIPHGHGPDVFLDAHERLGDYRERHLVAPVEFDASTFDEAAVAAVTLDGERWAVPLALKCLALYLREGTAAPSSLDALLGKGRLAYEASNAYGHAPILHAFGGRILDPSGRYAFADGPAERSLAWVLAAQRRGSIPEETSGALVTQMFASGAATAAISGPWLAAELPADLRYRVVPIPPVVERWGSRRDRSSPSRARCSLPRLAIARSRSRSRRILHRSTRRSCARTWVAKSSPRGARGTRPS
jgi:arabinogalactan oligomer/maltooligosaccharide transport system permease protein